MNPPRNSERYEFSLVVLMFFAWGTVFLDRMSLFYLAPYFTKDLHLSNAQVGMLASALAITWAFSGLFFGAVSDRIGRRPVLIPAVFVFSALSWLSGLARSFGQMFFVRGLMGVAEGPSWSTMTATIEESSAPQRRGRNIGVVVSAGALVGMALAPVMTTQIASRFGWRAGFFASGIPGLFLGLLLWKFLRESARNVVGDRDGSAAVEHPRATWRDYVNLLRYRNVWLCAIGATGFMTWLFVMHAFAPLYITEVSKRTPTLAGLVIGASGLGAFVWGWLYPWFSDRFGRKPMLLLIALISAFTPLAYQVPFLVLHPWLMAGAAFIANGGQAISALVLVLIPTESVPARFSATAIGMVTLIGEIFGGTLAPSLAGKIADQHGLASALWIAAAGAIMVFLAAAFMTETAPSKTAAAQS